MLSRRFYFVRKALLAGGLAFGLCLMGTLPANATIIDYTNFTLYTLVTNKIINPTPSTCVSCKSGSNSKVVNPAVYPSSVSTIVNNSYSNLLGTITAKGEAVAAVQNSVLHNVSLDAFGGVSSTFGSKSYEAITTQDARFYGWFAGMGNVSLPITIASKFSTTSNAITYQDSLVVTLTDLTTGVKTTLYTLSNYTTSGVFHTSVDFSTVVGQNYLLSTTTGFEQLDYIYGAGSTNSFSQLEIGAPEPSTYILIGTGLAALVALF